MLASRAVPVRKSLSLKKIPCLENPHIYGIRLLFAHDIPILGESKEVFNMYFIFSPDLHPPYWRSTIRGANILKL